jgi:hypothetical protein
MAVSSASLPIPPRSSTNARRLSLNFRTSDAIRSRSSNRTYTPSTFSGCAQSSISSWMSETIASRSAGPDSSAHILRRLNTPLQIIRGRHRSNDEIISKSHLLHLGADGVRFHSACISNARKSHQSSLRHVSSRSCQSSSFNKFALSYAPYGRQVFVNCPYDEAYLPLLRVLRVQLNDSNDIQRVSGPYIMRAVARANVSAETRTNADSRYTL